MYNRYNGITGRFERMPDPEPMRSRPISVPRRQGLPHGSTGPARPAQGPGVQAKPPSRRGGGLGASGNMGGLGNILPLGKIQEVLNGILPKVMPDGLETEDLLLLLVLYLMYKESGDKELLIIMGAMFLL